MEQSGGSFKSAGKIDCSVSPCIEQSEIPLKPNTCFDCSVVSQETKTSGGGVKSEKLLNVFVDWGVRKKSVAILESVSAIESKKSVEFFTAEELFGKIKQSFGTFQSKNSINCFVESGAPAFFLHQLIQHGFNIHIVDGKEVKAFRGNREKTDLKDVEYIRDLYHQKPELFKPLTEPQKTEIHAKYCMAKYNHYTKDLARFKNRQTAYSRQFGENETYNQIITILKTHKQEALKEALPFIQEDLEKINIKGVGKTLIAEILTSANPHRFPSLSAYLAFCGYNQHSNETNKYNRTAKTTAFQMAKSCIMHKNPEWYPFYLKLKEDLKNRFPEDRKGKINGKAINRLATFLLKQIWNVTRNSDFTFKSLPKI